MFLVFGFIGSFRESSLARLSLAVSLSFVLVVCLCGCGYDSNNNASRCLEFILLLETERTVVQEKDPKASESLC